MGWEERNGCRYYYRKERTPEGVRSVYVGAGPAAEDIARLDELAGEAVATERTLHRLRFAPIDEALASLRRSEAALRTYARAFLLATGHRTHRGQWRRARALRPHVATLPPLLLPPAVQPDAERPFGPEPMARKKNAAPAPLEPGATLGTETGAALTVPDGLDAKTAAALARAFEACRPENPKPEDVSRFRDVLARLPASAFQPFADRIALRSAAALFAGSVNTAAAFAEAEAERFAAELAGEDAGPLVRAAAAQAATARLVLDAVTERYGRALRGGYSFREADSFERRLSAAQTRYLRALATVALLRRAEEAEAERAGLPSPAVRAAARARLARREAARGEREPTGHGQWMLPRYAGDGLPEAAEVELGSG